MSILSNLPLPADSGGNVRWGELYGSALALAIVAAAERHSGPVLVLAATARDAEKLADELKKQQTAELEKKRELALKKER